MKCSFLYCSTFPYLLFVYICQPFYCCFAYFLQMKCLTKVQFFAFFYNSYVLLIISPQGQFVYTSFEILTIAVLHFSACYFTIFSTFLGTFHHLWAELSQSTISNSVLYTFQLFVAYNNVTKFLIFLPQWICKKISFQSCFRDIFGHFQYYFWIDKSEINWNHSKTISRLFL